MRSFTYIIGSKDDFESYEALEAAYFADELDVRNASVFNFTLPDVASSDLTVDDIAMLVGRGLAFENGWCMDDTYGDILEA